VGWLAVALAAACGPAHADSTVEQRVLERIQSARRAVGLPGLEPRDDLTVAAHEWATRVAGAPHSRRLAIRPPVLRDLPATGSREIVRLTTHLDLEKGQADVAAALETSWRRMASWPAGVVSPATDAVGLAAVVAADGWTVLAVLLARTRAEAEPPDPRRLEHRVLTLVNGLRLERGLRELVLDAALADAARSHSDEMARHGYVGHTSLDGREPADRVRSRGRTYRRLGENIQRNDDFDDPAGTAVRSWLDSRSHRTTMLLPEFQGTGVGCAVDARCRVYFTQLFVEGGR
jgi:uncharacterized protein YkwD